MTSGTMHFLKIALSRRRRLREAFNVRTEFSTLEESCLPSYVHGNVVSAAVAWSRLDKVARLFRSLSVQGPVLDFGSSTGELFHVLKIRSGDYHFIETNDRLADFLRKEIRGAKQCSVDALPAAQFAAIFALDSLE